MRTTVLQKLNRQNFLTNISYNRLKSFTPNYGNNVLSDQLPFLGHLENPVIKDVIIDGVVDNLSLQKYLLATGLLKDSIQDSLDMIVTYGKFNDASVRRALNTKYLPVMKKSNPIDLVFKDKTKCDMQNLLIGTLLTQIHSEKTNEKTIEKQTMLNNAE